MILILLFVITLVSGQVSHQAIDPQIVKVHIGRQIRTIPQNTAFNKKFQMMGYDIGGKIYQTHTGLVDASLFDSSYYQSSKSCTLYRSELKLGMIDDISLSNKENIESIVSSDRFKSIFAIMSNETYSQSENKKTVRSLVRFDFNRSDIFKSESKINVEKLGLNSSQSLDIKLVVLEDLGRVIIGDGVKLVSVDYQNFSNFKEIPVDQKGSKQYDYNFAEKNDLLKFSLCHFSQEQGKGILLMTWNTALRVYNLIQNATKAVLAQELEPPTKTYFTDAIPDHGRYWSLTDSGQFVAFRPQDALNTKYDVQIVELQSKNCFQLNKYKSTLHLICQQSGLNYVAEMYFNQTFSKPEQAFKLNRYYNQIDDVRLLFRFGNEQNPKLIISGDNQLMVVPYAVNREVLLQSNYQPRATRLRSLGVQLIHSLPGYSNFTHSYAIGVGQYFIALFMLIEQPPEMECRVMRSDQGSEFNILVELNTTSCVGNGQKQQLKSICTYYIPFNMYASLVEVDAANHKTIVATVLLLLLAIAIMIIGCGFYCKTNVEKAKMEIKKKIDAMKKRGEKRNKPI